MSARALAIGLPARATIDSRRIDAVIHCWPSLRWLAGMKKSKGRSIVTGWPSNTPSVRMKLTVR